MHYEPQLTLLENNPKFKDIHIDRQKTKDCKLALENISSQILELLILKKLTEGHIGKEACSI